MHAHDVAFAEMKLSPISLSDASRMIFCNVHSRPRRCIFFLRMMAFEDLSGILMLQDPRCRPRRLKKQVDADGKVRAHTRNPVPLFSTHLAHFVQIANTNRWFLPPYSCRR